VPTFPDHALLQQVGIDQPLEREHLVPFFLGQQLALEHHDLVQRLSLPVTFARDLSALLVTEQRFEHGNDAERIEHHVARVLVVGGDADDAVLAQAV